MFDAIIVGARCAGSSTALLLARAGYRVLLVDRATFPSDVISTHLIFQPGMARFKRWGILDRIVRSNCPPIRTMSYDLGEVTLRGVPPADDGVAEAYAPRRRVIDTILVEAAVAVGAELRQRFVVEGLLVEGDRVVGIEGRADGGCRVKERARLVVGADGMRSLVARLVGAPPYNERPPLACYYYSYWSNVPMAGFEGYQRGRRLILAFPTNDGLTCILVGWPRREFAAFRADVDGNFQRTLALVPAFAERVRQGKREEKIAGTADLPNFYRRPFGPGWALVGDAGYHKDPRNAQGITDACRDAESLAAALGRGFAGTRRLDAELAEYERERNETSLAMYEFTCQRARLEPPSEQMVQLFRLLHENQAQADRFLGTVAGTVPIRDFFSPENLQALRS